MHRCLFAVNDRLDYLLLKKNDLRATVAGTLNHGLDGLRSAIGQAKIVDIQLDFINTIAVVVTSEEIFVQQLTKSERFRLTSGDGFSGQVADARVVLIESMEFQDRGKYPLLIYGKKTLDFVMCNFIQSISRFKVKTAYFSAKLVGAALFAVVHLYAGLFCCSD